MNPIREFFRKRAAERRFKTAGPAHKLTESESRPPKDKRSSQKGQSSQQQHRTSTEAERAAAAATARLEQQKRTDLDWSSQAIRNQAKKELELENARKEQAVSQTKQIVHVQADCPNFTVSGVYFTCPIIGPEVLPKSEVVNKIRSFLYDQLEQERGLTACLIIHTLNKNKLRVQKGVETLSRYLTNIIDQPTEEKYRKIRLKNKIFQERIVDLEGAFDFLLAAGFTQEILKLDNAEEEEEYLILRDEDLDIEKLQMLKEAILSAEPILPVLDRNLKVLKPAEFVEKVNLPQDFFNLTLDEVKKEQETRTETVEMLTQLRTKAMREKEEIRERHFYKYSLIRIRFPDGIILQGTFSVYEKLLSVREFVAENLANPTKEFELLLPGGVKLTDDNQSLLELKLAPAAVLNFQISDDNGLSGSVFLNSECMSLLSDL